MHILHLEDSRDDAELIEGVIRQEWPDCRISLVANQDEYRRSLEGGGIDVIVSDYSIPGFDGLAALSLAQAHCPGKPFIFLSGTIGEERAVEALKRGATDYVIKDRPGRIIPSIRQALALRDEADRLRRVETVLREKEERFRQITENVTEYIALLDLQGVRVYVNPTYRQLGDPAALAGRSAFDMIHPEDVAAFRSTFERTLRSGAGEAGEYRLAVPGVGVRHVEYQFTVVRDASRTISHVLLVGRDVTERKEAEARLQEQASLLDRARDAIIATDLEHRIAYWNTSAERLYGWKAAEVFGRRLDQLDLGFEPARFATARELVLARGEWRGDFRLRTKAGEWVLVESTWSLVVQQDGRPRSILSIDTDVTERKKLETQLLRAQRMESIGTLAGGVAHDLNNVLTPILLTIDLLGANLTNPEDRALLEKTRASANHGAALVQQLLAFARGGEAKRMLIEPDRALRDLQPLIRQSLPASIQLRLSIDEPVWPIQADATQFNQVLINLCINARDAMVRGGRIEIRTANVHVTEALARANPGAVAGPAVRISVVDSGAGIPAGIIEKIFDPFFTTKAAGKGTGLGLSMVAGIMKRHQGFVQVESEPGRGTTFYLNFPAVAATAVRPPRTVPSTAAGRGEGILLVDDEPAVRETLQLVLERAGYTVYAAYDAGSGISTFERHQDDVRLAITDMMLPDQPGTAVIKALRRHRPELPIIAISGMMGSGQFDELQQLTPVVECLAKPLLPSALLAAVRRGVPAGNA